jgi:prepilin-type N-terminal cleavage/methylation domain-containing protein
MCQGAKKTMNQVLNPNQQGMSLMEVMFAMLVLSLMSLLVGVGMLNSRVIEEKAQRCFETTLKEISAFERTLGTHNPLQFKMRILSLRA